MEYRTTLGMLSVLAVGGKEIKGRSMFSVSPYITFQIDHMKKKTKVSKGKGKNPKWNDLIEFEIIKGRDILNGKVMGKEISEDEFIGDIKVDLKPIFQKGYAEMWVPVIHPHKNRHKGDVFLKLQYKPAPKEPGFGMPMPPPMGAPAPGAPPMGPPGAPPMGPPGAPPMGPPGTPMGGPARPPPPQLQRSATAPIQMRPPPGGVQIPPRQGGPMPSPVNIPPRGASPNIRPFPSPIPQRQGSAMQARPPIRQVEEPQSYDHSAPPPSELKHALTTPAPHANGSPMPAPPARSQTYNPPPPQRSPSHPLPPRQMSHPQIQTAPGVSPRIQPPRSPRPVSPNPNGVNIPQRMPRPPMGPRPSQ